MGDTGPCGPCTEIFYDHGPGIAGGPPGSPNEDGDRYVEIWNLVFMQYDRSADGTLTPLPKPSVDTGMGLERIAAVMQGVHCNYDIDLFRDLIAAAAKHTGTTDLQSSSLRVIADHIRACSFLIADGVLPSNEGRGYVLRRIIRRAIRHGYKLGQREPFFHKLVATLDAGWARPIRSSAQRAHIEQVLEQEEERFAETLAQGMALLDGAIARLSGQQIPGETVFKLYDTYGFPVDLTADIARERGLTIDEAGFEAAMEEQRERARAASKFGVDLRAGVLVEGQTEFTGYESERATGPRGRADPRHRNASRSCAPARRGRWCSTPRRSTPRAAARSATAACSRPARRASSSPTRRRSARRTCTSAISRAARCAPATASRREVDHALAAGHPLESLGDAPAARRAAQGARHPCHAEGLAGGARPAALRLLALLGGDAGRAARDRAARQRRDPRQRRGRDAR